MSAEGDALGLAIKTALELQGAPDVSKRIQSMKDFGNALWDNLVTSGGLGTHTHSGAANQGPKLVQANTHESADTDAAPASLHHTLGTGVNQACGGADTRLSDARTPTLHGIADATKHSSASTPGKMQKANANGLPVDATNTDGEVSAAVSASHARSHALESGTDHTTAITDQRVTYVNLGVLTACRNTESEMYSATTLAHNQFLFPYFGRAASASLGSTRIIEGFTNLGAPRVATLLTSQCVVGRVYCVKDETGDCSLTNYLSIVGQGGELIDKQASKRLVTPYAAVWLYSNGTAWFTVEACRTVAAVESTAVSITASIYADSVAVTDTSAARTITLATAECAKVGRRYTITNDTSTPTFPVSVVGQGGELLDGEASQQLYPWDAMTVEARGTYWKVV